MSIPESGLRGQSRWFRVAHDNGREQAPPPFDWPPIDTVVLDDRADPVPPFPLVLLPQPWSDWVGDTARAVGAPADYVAQAVLGAAAGLAGTRARIRVSPVWEEPLALWLALVGPPSSGKTPALAAVRRLLDGLEGTDEDPKPCIIDGPGGLATVADTPGGGKQGVMLWQDEPLDSLAFPGAGRELAALPVNVLCSLEPDRLAQTLRRSGDRQAARFLYVWPRQPAYCPLAGRKPARDADASDMLRRVLRLPGSPAYPFLLLFDDSGVDALDGFLNGMHAHLREIEGLEAAWVGKAGGMVARLAGVLELLDWSATQSPSPRPIGSEQVTDAVTLWLEYFRPHAKAFLDRAAPSDVDRRARRVVRWLRATGAQQLSREDVRRHALGRTVDAAGAEAVLSRLTGAGVLHCLPLVIGPGGGRPAFRWEVNPALATASP